jgi:coenzyme F420-0:L-glutamate ligase / coenzyme F420-1:gamma-L-glutamate ligase
MSTTFQVPERIELFGVPGLGEIAAGDALGKMLCAAMDSTGLSFHSGDVLVVAQKIVSKAEGRLVELRTVTPSPFAESLATSLGPSMVKDPRAIEVVLSESRRIVRMDAGLIIAETHQGYVCANAGVDSSNVPNGFLCLLPINPDASATRLREEIRTVSGVDVAVIISDTFGRPWREGLTNVALGVAGLPALQDYRGQKDEHGHTLAATVIATADELAGAAELLMGKMARRPAVVIRGFIAGAGEGKGADLVRPREKDLFR